MWSLMQEETNMTSKITDYLEQYQEEEIVTTQCCST
jgi:hypothetical protein